MTTQRPVSFTSDGLTLRGNLHLPPGAGSGARRPALVFSGPFTGVKEQVTGTYARRLAERGFVTLSFDHRNFGESDGEPRQHEDGPGKLRDLTDAVSFLRTLEEVDPARIGACGICLGTSYILKFAAFDPRVKAVALVAGAYNDSARMRQMFGAERYRERLAEFAEIRQRQYQGGEVEYIPAVAEEGPAGMPGKEPFEYYGTDRARSPGWKNQVTRLSTASLITFDALPAADFISPTPMLIVHGKVDAFCSPESAQAAFDRAGEPKELVWLPTTNHIDLYDQEEYVAPALTHAGDWFERHLQSSSAG
jgi:uncharacterized protein